MGKLITKFNVVEVYRKDAALVKRLKIEQGDIIEVSLPLSSNTSYKSYMDVTNLTKNISEHNYSFNMFCNFASSESLSPAIKIENA